MMTWFMAIATAASVPGRIWICTAAFADIQLIIGSTTTSCEPRFMASVTQKPWKQSALERSGFAPQMRMVPGTVKSG